MIFPPQYEAVPENAEIFGGLDRMRTILFKSLPHLENGANGHPTDKYDVRLILRELEKMGVKS